MCHARVNKRQVSDELEQIGEMSIGCAHLPGSGWLPDTKPTGRLAVISDWHDTGVISAIPRSLVTAAQVRGHVECFFNLSLYHYTHGFVKQSGEFMNLNIPYCYRALKFRGSKP